MEKKPLLYKIDIDNILMAEDKSIGVNRIANTATPAIIVVGNAFNKSRDIQEKILNEVVYTEALRYAESTKQTVEEGMKEISELEYTEAKDKSSYSNRPISNVYTSNSILDFDDPSGDGVFMLRYSYEGPFDNKNRDFCRQMITFSNDSVWSYEDITTDLDNPEFGSYNLFTYKGSYNCRHEWKRRFFYKDFDTKEARKVGSNAGSVARGLAIGDGAATKENGRVFSTEFKNIDNMKMRIVAPAMIPDIKIPRMDEETEEEYFVMFEKEAIERLYVNFQSKRLGVQFNIEHDDSEKSSSFILETWIIETDTDKAYTKYGFKESDVPIGSWMIISQFEDQDSFLEILENKQLGYSVEGKFETELVMNKVKNKNKNHKMKEEIVEIEGKKYTFSLSDEGKLSYTVFKEDEDEDKKDEDLKKDEKKDEDLAEDKDEDKEDKEDMASDDKDSEDDKEDLAKDDKEDDKEDKEDLAEDENPEGEEEPEEGEKDYYTKEDIDEKLKGLLDMIAKLESEIESKDNTEGEEDESELSGFTMSFSDRMKKLNELKNV